MAHQPVKFFQVGSFAAGNRLLEPEARTVQARGGRSNTLTSGHRACQGCGEALGARYALDAAMRATNGRLIAANATGCLEVFSTPYPESSWQLPWIHSLFANAPAVATGIAAALKVKGRDERVVAQGGDGAHRRHRLRRTLRHVRARRRRALHLLRQRGVHEHRRPALGCDAARGARTANTKPTAGDPGNDFGQGKSVPLIAMAHEIPYVATATVADLHDLEAKVERAMSMHGAPLPPHPRPVSARLGSEAGGHDPARPTREGVGPLPGVRGGARRGHGCLEDPPAGARRGVPAAAAQVRPSVRQASPRPDVVERLQAIADRNIRRFGLLPRRRKHHDEQAVRNHARGRFQPRQQDGHVAHRAPDLRRSAASLQHRLSRRREHPGLAVRGRGGRREATSVRGGRSWRRTPSRRSWAGSVTTPAKPPATGRRSTRPSESTRSSASSATSRSSKAGAVSVDAAASGKRVLVVGAGPSGLSAAYHLARLGHEVTVRDAGPGRWDDEVRNSALPATSRDPRRRDRPDRGARRPGRARIPRSERLRSDARRRVRCRLRCRWRPDRQARLRSGR